MSKQCKGFLIEPGSMINSIWAIKRQIFLFRSIALIRLKVLVRLEGFLSTVLNQILDL